MKDTEKGVQKKGKKEVQIIIKLHELPVDVKFNILSRLSVKDIHRFICVSKDIQRYILNPCFNYSLSSTDPFSVSLTILDKSKFEREKSIKTQFLLSVIDHKGQTITEFTPKQEIQLPNKLCFILLPSHENLVCISTTDHTYICDPSTQEFLELPSISSDLILTDTLSVGFGYIPSKNVYKVVRFFHTRFFVESNDINGIGCKILTISNYKSGRTRIGDCCSEWRVLEDGTPHIVADSIPTFVNGSVHWKIHPATERALEKDAQIMAFNLEDEKFWVFPTPAFLEVDPEPDPRLFNLAELKGKLWLNHFEIIDDNIYPQVMDMWILKDYEKFTWVKEYTIDFSVLNLRTYVDCGTLVLNIRNDELLISMGYNQHQVFFNLKTKGFRDLRNLRDEDDGPFSFCYYTDLLHYIRKQI